MISDSKMIFEQLRSVDEEKLSRRELLRRSGIAIGAVALTGIVHELNQGVSLRKPPLDLRPVRLEKGVDDLQLFSYGKSEVGLDRILTITSGKLFFEPSGEFFTPEREFQYIHRANSIKFIHKAHKKGADLFDIDANDVGGFVWAEHGKIPQIDFSLGGLDVDFPLPIILDQHEQEIKIGEPAHSYADLVECIASLNTPSRPLAVSTELKRGKFAPDTLNEMLDIHLHYNVPVMMYSGDELLFDGISV